MTPQIVTKINREIQSGITSEAQVVYILAEIRKIIEQENSHDDYKYLYFHCNWALHYLMRKSQAQKVLSYFSEAHTEITEKGNSQFHGEYDAISKMDRFKDELSIFCNNQSITNFTNNAASWLKFIKLYVQVIEDCALVIESKELANQKRITITVEYAKEPHEGENFFKVIWLYTSGNEQPFEFYVLNSLPVVS